MRLKFIQIGYLFGVSLLLASIFYFFASNWQGFERLTKVGLSISITILFFITSLLLTKVIKTQSFLSHWSYFASVISFGLGLALIGQLYNSHADYYMLFFIWLIPSVVASVFTKYQPFYLLSYILLHIGIYFYLNPSSYHINWTETQLLIIILVIILLNSLLFIVTGQKYLKSAVIQYPSIILIHILFIALTNSDAFPTYGFWMNVGYVLFAIGGLYYYLKLKPHKPLMILFSMAGAAFVLVKGFELMSYFFGDLFLFLLLLFVIVLVFASVKLLQFFKKQQMHTVVRTVLVGTVTFVATVFATISVVGLIMTFFQDIPFWGLFIFAIFALIIPGIFGRWEATVKYTLLCTGYAIAFGSSIFEDVFIWKIIFLIVVVFGWVVIKVKGLQVIQFLLVNLVFGIILGESFDLSIELVMLILLLCNASLYVLLTTRRVSQATALTLAFCYFITLTVIPEVGYFVSLIYNISFFIIVTAFVLVARKRQWQYELIISLVFWFLFIGYKYYDLAWMLIHKSLLFFIVGILFIVVTRFFERRKKEKAEIKPGFVWPLRYLLIVLLLFQLGYMGFAAFSAEALLQNGVTIKLKLAPIDPRSLLQGDYVRLNYDISTIEDLQHIELHHNQLVEIVLQKNKVTGIYQYANVYSVNGSFNTTYTAQPDDVIITGRYDGWNNVYYGIETYFVPEGTGLDVQENANYAIVKVGENGNAILQGLTEN
ncbi:DUF2157 domain-containing protein [Bacillus sp. HMF5848]|uniref:GDYXXLXY domain-containing protein n=1 Tax=Bacillus sp. HMF5848 TaxID=2495421 RepID=UPI000F77E221|nr:GDYXXLXY domain-containing protein [Bacillus sp. HMF5848]RSK26762.1 DUF2157 domain-containing protein [Bacillus sp. HMF5848]